MALKENILQDQLSTAHMEQIDDLLSKAEEKELMRKLKNMMIEVKLRISELNPTENKD